MFRIGEGIFSHAIISTIQVTVNSNYKRERHGGEMDQEERWNQFAATGKIMDYLEYRKGTGEAGCTFPAEGSREHERDSSTYRDDINGISHERIR